MGKGKKKSGLVIGLIIFGVLALGSIVSSGIAGILDDSETTKAVSSKPEEKKTEPPKRAEAPKEEVTKKKFGRCSRDLKGTNPSYLGDTGYVTVERFDYSSEYLLKNINNWKVHLVEQTGPENFTEIDKTVAHKTKVKVIEEFLGDRCIGALKVKNVETGEEFFINVRNFSVASYWDFNISDTYSYGVVIAEYFDENLIPLDRDKNWYKIPKGTKVLTNSYKSPEKLQGFILDKNDELVSLEFDIKSLKTVY